MLAGKENFLEKEDIPLAEEERKEKKEKKKKKKKTKKHGERGNDSSKAKIFF